MRQDLILDSVIEALRDAGLPEYAEKVQTSEAMQNHFLVEAEKTMTEFEKNNPHLPSSEARSEGLSMFLAEDNILSHCYV